MHKNYCLLTSCLLSFHDPPDGKIIEGQHRVTPGEAQATAERVQQGHRRPPSGAAGGARLDTAGARQPAGNPAIEAEQVRERHPPAVAAYPGPHGESLRGEHRLPADGNRDTGAAAARRPLARSLPPPGRGRRRDAIDRPLDPRRPVRARRLSRAARNGPSSPRGRLGRTRREREHAAPPAVVAQSPLPPYPANGLPGLIAEL